MEQEFKELLLSTNRPGIEKLLEFLQNSDFFIAPASTKYHDSHPRGLLEHSLRVYKLLSARINSLPNIKPKEDTLIIIALLHDICKTNYYKITYRNIKDESTNWEWKKVPYFTIEDALPYGHGEKSVYIISKYIDLTEEEAFAIRFHMGFTEPKELYQTISAAYKKYPLGLLLHEADLEATYDIDI